MTQPEVDYLITPEKAKEMVQENGFALMNCERREDQWKAQIRYAERENKLLREQVASYRKLLVGEYKK